MNELKEINREKLQAAYALNLCTVSVSQIIDYADIAILEQEYEAILNNLNLEYMPKDEALLDILKRLLETINFFKIQEGDKKFIEREYQQKMKNAIWTAVPNLSLLVAGGNPAAMLFSAATQIGIGYMNYRRNRSEYQFQQEEKMWKLRRTALEQFHSLQQQLFETAWRLADKYDFPDELRLTEKQIKQYNAILMDNDEVRKYERLRAVQGKFKAYPPFWYYLGNVANAIANSNCYGFDQSSKNAFKERAKEHFAYFHEANRYNLLREDNIAAACSLEYISLLDAKADKDKIIGLIKNAEKMAGESFDIMQLCAMAYIKVGCRAEAIEILRGLVNEQYNCTMNAQLLSTLYVEEYIYTGNQGIKGDYKLLKSRVSEEYLFPFMEKTDMVSREALEADFIKAQRQILRKKYKSILQQFIDKYEVLLNRIIPLPDDFGGVLPDVIYKDTPAAGVKRMQEIELLQKNAEKKVEYAEQISRISYSYEFIKTLRQMFDSICIMECIYGEQKRLELANIMNVAIKNKKDEIQKIDTLLKAHPEEMKIVEIYRNSQEITMGKLAGEFFGKIQDEIITSVESKTDMSDFALAEENLVKFCQQEGFKEPEYLYEHRADIKENEVVEPYIFLPESLDKGTKEIETRVNRYKKMMETIKRKKLYVVKNHKEVDFYTEEDPKMERYFYNRALQKYTGIRTKTLAVLDDKSTHDMDLIFTTEGIIPVIKEKGYELVPYRDIKQSGDVWNGELTIVVPYTNPNLNMTELANLIYDLKKV